jgi:hypothetical protein
VEIPPRRPTAVAPAPPWWTTHAAGWKDGRLVYGAQRLGIVWVGCFLILDRWLFRLAGDTPEHAAEIIGEVPA